MKKIYILLVAIVLVVSVFYLYKNNLNKKEILLSKTVYTCDQGKQIEASYYDRVNKPKQPQGEAPMVYGRVQLVFNNAEPISLKQTISASGVRYANQDESFIFWNKGNEATVLEGNREFNYLNCKDLSKQDMSLLKKDYESKKFGFKIKIPEKFEVIEDYKYEPLPTLSIPGVKFKISEDIYKGTNLSGDTYISIEKIDGAGNACTGDKFTYVSEPLLSLTVNDIKYSVAHTAGAGVGNRYEEFVYATRSLNDCIGVRYYIHDTVYENYPEGSVRRYDDNALKSLFDSIRQTIVYTNNQ